MNLGQYWSLVKTLAVSEFKLRFAHSALGYMWTLSKPLMLFGAMYIVFSQMLRFGEGIPHYPILLLAGIMLWGFFAEATSAAVTVLVARADLIRKAWFPRSALAVSVVLTALTVFLCNLVALGALVAASGLTPTLSWLILPLIIIELIVLTIGTSLLLSGLYVFLRDIAQLWAVFLQVLFYLTPIIYPIELLQKQGIPSFWLRLLLSNPLAQIAQDLRRSLAGGGTQWSFQALGPWTFVPFLCIAIIFLAGMLVYRYTSDRLAERV